MYFYKPVNQITFEDVVNFLKQDIAENTLLDYKLMLPRDNEKFAKTIAAFANSMGGTIIIGVKDEHDKPKPPFSGITFHPKIRGQIESIIQNYIDPVVFVDIATCKDPNSDSMFVVVNIPQSNLTPHLVGRLKRAYVRTGQSSRPEIIVHPDNLPWLLDNRKKSQNLRHILLDKAEAHFNNFLRANYTEQQSAQTVASFALVPLYPQTPITDYKQLPALLKKIQFDCEGGLFPNDTEIKTVQDGIVLPMGKTASLEINCYGLTALKIIPTDKERFIDPQMLYRNAILFFRAAAAFYRQLGFISPLMLRVKVSNARGSRIKTDGGEKQLIEDYVRIDRNVSPLDLQNNLAHFTASLLEEFAWSVGLPFKQDQDALNIVRSVTDKCKDRVI